MCLIVYRVVKGLKVFKVRLSLILLRVGTCLCLFRIGMSLLVRLDTGWVYSKIIHSGIVH